MTKPLRVEEVLPRSTMSSPTQEQAAQILAKVPAEKTFRFYTDIGSATPTHADSLESFLGTIRNVETKSIEFHMSRGDFENWIQMLGDDLLARQVANLKEKNLTGEPLRKRLLQILQLRYGRLRKSSAQGKT